MNRGARFAAFVAMLGIVGTVATPSVQAAVSAEPSDCPLVPTADAGRAIGIDLKLSSPPVTVGTRPTGQTVTCTWDVEDAQLTSALSARLATGPKQEARYTKARRRSHDRIAVSGLGQQAFWTPTSGRLLVLVDANTLVTIVHQDPTSSGGPGYRAASEAIAALVIARL